MSLHGHNTHIHLDEKVTISILYRSGGVEIYLLKSPEITSTLTKSLEAVGYYGDCCVEDYETGYKIITGMIGLCVCLANRISNI
jgi:hypothetical protein